MLNLTFFTGGIAQTNGWVLTTPAGALVFDAPEGMADWLDKKQLRVSALLLTHQHFDHVLDAAAIQKRHQCPVYSFAEHSKSLTLETFLGTMTGMGWAVEPYRVDHLLEGQDSLRVCEIEWQLFHVPGHSPDSVCFYSAAHGLLFGGDVLFAGSIGRSDFPGGSMKQLVQGIAEKLLPLPDATRVFPGHGPETTIGDERDSNPYLE